MGTDLTPDSLSKYGIEPSSRPSPARTSTLPNKRSAFNDTYQDLRNLGAIFGVPNRADQVISAMLAQVAAVRKKVAGLKPVTVFDYDRGQSAPFTGPGLAMPNALINLGGGKNVFRA